MLFRSHDILWIYGQARLASSLPILDSDVTKEGLPESLDQQYNVGEMLGRGGGAGQCVWRGACAVGREAEREVEEMARAAAEAAKDLDDDYGESPAGSAAAAAAAEQSDDGD